MMNLHLASLRTGSFALLLFALAGIASATSFGVSPLRVELGGASRTAVVTVTNDSATPLFLKVYAVSWSMDENGQEQYSETSDLVFFPKALTIPAGDKRVVRVGAEIAAGATEKTYRLFLKETPDESAPPAPRAQVAMLVNFGVPVFLKAPAAKAKLVATATATVKGKVAVNLENTGAASARMESVSFVDGTPLTIGSAYVLAGRTRTLTLPVTAKDCARGQVQSLEIGLGAEQFVKVAADLTRACL